jgi:hypothetical protein
MSTATAPTLPFTRYKNVPLPDVPTDFFQWLLRTVHLSSGLRAAVCAELARRGVEAPPAPPPQPRTCPKCGPAAPVGYAWFRDSLDRAHIRARCLRCGGSLGNVPQVQPFTSMVDAAGNCPGAGTIGEPR